MKAVIKTGGKQYYVSEGESIYVEKLDQEAGSEVVFDQVLMIDSKVGNPYLDGATVVGKVEKHGKNKKIVIFKYLSIEVLASYCIFTFSIPIVASVSNSYTFFIVYVSTSYI